MARMKYFENIGLYYEWGYACLCLLIPGYCSSDILHLSWYSWTSIHHCRWWCWSPSSISDSFSRQLRILSRRTKNTGNDRNNNHSWHRCNAQSRMMIWQVKGDQLKPYSMLVNFNRGPRGGNPNLGKPRNASKGIILLFYLNLSLKLLNNAWIYH